MRAALTGLVSFTILYGADLVRAQQGLPAVPRVVPADLKINQIQFVGSHNSYKKAMHPHHMEALRARNPQAAASLDYAHLPIHKQLDKGMRVLEIDLFVDASGVRFPVGHVQEIDMNSHCLELVDCLTQIRAWSEAHPHHVPIWLMFNLKDAQIEGLPDPNPFTPATLKALDEIFRRQLGDRLIEPDDVEGLAWPTLSQSRGKFILLLDEGGEKREWYAQLESPAMFGNFPKGHPRAAIMVMNDPMQQQAHIQALVTEGFMVRTRADADTLEARANDNSRRDAAFASGAQAVSTDYYLPAEHFGTDYQVSLTGTIRCNPISAPLACEVSE